MMKKISLLLILVFGILIYSCNNTNDIDLSLRLSMRVLQKSYEGTGYWEYDKTVFPNGHWILYDSGAALHGDEVYAVEELKQPRKHPTVEKVEAIKDALKHFEVI